MTNRLPAQTKAMNHLLQCLKKNPGSTVGTVRELSKEAGVSHVTMWKVLHRAKEDGLLAISQNRISSLNAPASQVYTPTVPIPPPLKKWEIVAGKIQTDIARGHYPAGSVLPTALEMMAELSTSFPTLKKSLDLLKKQGRIENYKRGYRVPDFHRLRPGAQFLCIGGSPVPDVQNDLSPRAKEFWRLLETSCQRHNLQLTVRSFGEFLANPKKVLSQQMLPVGCLIHNLDLRPELLGEVLHILQSSKIPVAVVDEMGLAPRYVPLHPAIKVFSVANSSRAGWDVGMFLQSAGHRKVAWFSAFAGEDWSTNRRKGLEEVFTKMHVANNTLQSIYFEHELREELLQLPCYKTLGKSYAEFTRINEWPEETPAYLQTMFYQLTVLYLHTKMKQLFSTALKDKSITAWVTCNDQVGLVAKKFLESQRVKTIALVSFDDTFEALSAGLASYNFNIGELIHAVFDFILRFDRYKSARSQSELDIGGMVIPRESSYRNAI